MNISNQLKTITISLILAALVGSFSVLAQTGKQVINQPDERVSYASDGQAKAFRYGHRLGVRRLLAQLNLTDDQKTRIRTIFANHRDAFRALHEQLREKRVALREAARTEPFDEALVRSRAQEVANVQVEMMVARTRLVNEVTSVLTPEQKAKLDELREQRRQRFLRWQERHLNKPHQQEG